MPFHEPSLSTTNSLPWAHIIKDCMYFLLHRSIHAFSYPSMQYASPLNVMRPDRRPRIAILSLPYLSSASTSRPSSHFLLAAFRSMSSSPLISHMLRNDPSSLLIRSHGCPYSITSPPSSTSTLS